jgi:2-polyprenyl-6-methoxyphenol hydroxylase-like FAD-dependent oxidoreductase
MSAPTSDVPVLIVGGGPAGLTASLLLSRHGVRSLLIDRRTAASTLPRARGVHSRAMEILRIGGAEPAMRKVELPITPGAQWRPSLAADAVREDAITAASEDDVSPCEGLAVSQDVFEAVLREHVRAFADATIETGVRLDRLDVAEASAVAHVTDLVSGGRREIRARYVIAADGAHSRIRDRLGIAMNGDADLGQQEMIAFRADLSPVVGDHPRGIYFLTDSGAALIWTHPDDRWVISRPVASPDPVGAIGPSGRGPDVVREVLGLPGLDVTVLATNPWTAAALSASEYAAGPVLLVGDAAHRFPPVGATGVSAAMHDVHNLAWKIAAVLDGRAAPRLLDTYGVERKQVGERNVAETGAAWSRMFAGSGRPFSGRDMRQIDMGYQYRSSAVTPDGSADSDTPGTTYTPTGAPGCRAPHLWIDNGARSTIDLFDRDFVLLAGADHAGWLSVGATDATALGARLATRLMTERPWAQRFGVTSSGAVLVRPDGHVA